jgi:hypothetical protein
MRRTHLLAGLAATAVLATVSTAAATPDPESASSNSVGHRKVTFTYDEPFDGGTTKYVNLDKPELGPGDMFLTTGVPMLSEGTTKRIGMDDGTETVVSASHDGTVEMNMTLRLHDGLVMLSGVVRHTDKPFRLPVVGGTGAYSNATGQMSQLRLDDHRKVTIIKVELFLCRRHPPHPQPGHLSRRNPQDAIRGRQSLARRRVFPPLTRLPGPSHTGIRVRDNFGAAPESPRSPPRAVRLAGHALIAARSPIVRFSHQSDLCDW